MPSYHCMYLISKEEYNALQTSQEKRDHQRGNHNSIGRDVTGGQINHIEIGEGGRVTIRPNQVSAVTAKKGEVTDKGPSTSPIIDTGSASGMSNAKEEGEIHPSGFLFSNDTHPRNSRRDDSRRDDDNNTSKYTPILPSSANQTNTQVNANTQTETAALAKEKVLSPVFASSPVKQVNSTSPSFFADIGTDRDTQTDQVNRESIGVQADVSVPSADKIIQAGTPISDLTNTGVQTDQTGAAKTVQNGTQTDALKTVKTVQNGTQTDGLKTAHVGNQTDGVTNAEVGIQTAVEEPLTKHNIKSRGSHGKPLHRKSKHSESKNEKHRVTAPSIRGRNIPIDENEMLGNLVQKKIDSISGHKTPLVVMPKKDRSVKQGKVQHKRRPNVFLLSPDQAGEEGEAGSNEKSKSQPNSPDEKNNSQPIGEEGRSSPGKKKNGRARRRKEKMDKLIQERLDVLEGRRSARLSAHPRKRYAEPVESDDESNYIPPKSRLVKAATKKRYKKGSKKDNEEIGSPPAVYS